MRSRYRRIPDGCEPFAAIKRPGLFTGPTTASGGLRAERAGRHGPRLPRRPPGRTARVTRDPAAHAQARRSTITPSAHNVESLGFGSRHPGYVAATTTSLWTDNEDRSRSRRGPAANGSPNNMHTGNCASRSETRTRSCRTRLRPVNTSRQAPCPGRTISAAPQSAVVPTRYSA